MISSTESSCQNINLFILNLLRRMRLWSSNSVFSFGSQSVTTCESLQPSFTINILMKAYILLSLWKLNHVLWGHKLYLPKTDTAELKKVGNAFPNLTIKINIYTSYRQKLRAQKSGKRVSRGKTPCNWNILQIKVVLMIYGLQRKLKNSNPMRS